MGPIFFVIIIFSSYVFLIQFYKWYSISRFPIRRVSSLSTLIILGSGGHTTEMIKILSTLDLRYYSPRFYVVARSDNLSVRKLQENFGEIFSIVKVPRVREVGQSYASSVFYAIPALFSGMILLLRLRPQIILSNGPGTCLPLCLAAILLRNLSFIYIHVVYIESICRIATLSLSGNIMYPLADHFLVQWNDLTANYPKVKFVGRIL